MATSGVLPSTGGLIYIAIKPVIKLVISTLCGFGLVKANLFPQEGARILAQIVLNVAMPCLLFSSLATSFTPQNIANIGALLLLSILYIIFGFFLGFILRYTCRLPHNFKWGIVVASVLSNWGDLPISVLGSICAGPPFGPGDSSLAIAYCAIFIISFAVVLFPLRLASLIAKDYENELSEEEARKGTRERLPAFLGGPRQGRKRSQSEAEGTVVTQEGGSEGSDVEKALGASEAPSAGSALVKGAEKELPGPTPFSPPGSPSQPPRTRAEDIPPTAEGAFGESMYRSISAMEAFRLSQLGSQPMSQSRAWKVMKRVSHIAWDFLRSSISPSTVSLIIGLVVAGVTPLKALFLPVTEGTFHPIAPDGGAPLAVLYEVTVFIGAAAVPLNLIILGSTLARMSLPRPIRRLPLGAIAGTVIGKLCVLPVFGFFVVQAMAKHASFFNEEDNVLRFVCVYMACQPSATIQVTLTQLYAPRDRESNAGLLAAFLLVQYPIYAVASVIVTALSLSSIF